jgi:hypothetical protein
MVSCEREVTETIVVAENTDCFTCHNDQDFGDEVVAAKVQWDASQHAIGGNFERDGTSCSQCHTNEGFKAFLATGETIDPTNPSSIGCFTCHAPHTVGDFSLRTSAPVEFIAGGSFDMGAANLCANCHQARAHSPMVEADTVIITSSRWGAHHGPQANILSGQGAYAFDVDGYAASPTHGAIPDGCVNCHFVEAYGAQSGGHTFNMTYVYHGGVTDNVAGCNAEGCHTGLEDFDHDGVQDSVSLLLDSLDFYLQADSVLDDEHLYILADNDTLILDADVAKAAFNYLYFLEDRSFGIHNPAYALEVLTASFEVIQPAP